MQNPYFNLQIKNCFKKSFLTLALLIFFQAFSLSQQLSGNFIIGPSGDYINFIDAVSALNTNGVSGPVVFEVQSGTYTEQMVLGAIAGASETNTITFQSQSGNAEDVVLQYTATGTGDNYVIRLDNASHFAFRNLKIQSLGNGYSWTIAAINEVNDIVIEQCVLSAPDWSSRNFNAGNVRLNPSLSSNVRLINNRISGGDHGIYYSGGPNTYRAPGFELRDNEIAGAYAYGVYLQYLTGAVIEGNTITIRSTSWSSSYTLELSNVEGASRVVGNR
ncbi:right-handed parallel beta-helix repeat-containing protein, partial [Algoriphagus sp. CAU 1675]|uniref:right-handed parallel beta-helix repeat-containing protein n=1 Tax=Algoriphagus sp. CAU 1675 TaxID=3032597 RepID=UPI0023DC15FE